jgi:hypothetical protein
MLMPFIGINFFTLLTTIFWVWMLVDCIFNSRLRGGSKVGWFLLIFFTHWIGAIIYFFVAAEYKNPGEALNYYINEVNKFLPRRTGPFQQPPPSQPTPPQRKAYPQTHYQQGYQAQVPPVVPASENAAPPGRAVYHPQPEYEQPTATYPEMPMQEQ